jgi:uncharacterized phage protein (TIGR01671 family)
MSRELKFRAWNFVAKKMYYPENAGNIFLWQKEGQVQEIMQFTGLQDKNSKDIYEGDIVKYESRTWKEEAGEDPLYSNEVSTIVYSGKGFWVDAESFGWEGENLWDWDDIVIIGNIYENAEILNVQPR